jgi:hypothetical protein
MFSQQPLGSYNSPTSPPLDFPLYNELLQRASSDTNPVDLRQVSAIIKSITDNHSAEDCEIHYDNITALIIHHYYLNDYKGHSHQVTNIYGINIPKHKEVVKGLVVDMKKLPPTLQSVLNQYVNYHN